MPWESPLEIWMRFNSQPIGSCGNGGACHRLRGETVFPPCHRLRTIFRPKGRKILWGDENRLSCVEPEVTEQVRRHLNLGGSIPLRYGLHLDERAGGVDVLGGGPKIVCAMRLAVDLKQMRSDKHEISGRRIRSFLASQMAEIQRACSPTAQAHATALKPSEIAPVISFMLTK